MTKKTIAALGVVACAALGPAAGAQTQDADTTQITAGAVGWSYGCDVARHGRAVAFTSRATNLVAGDTNGKSDVFLWTVDGTQRVSVTSDEKQSSTGSFEASISDDGTRVAFTANRYRMQEPHFRPQGIFVRDAAAGLTTRVNVVVGGRRPNHRLSGRPAISGNGKHVAFYAAASNMVAGTNDTGWINAFVRSLDRGVTESVSLARDGDETRGTAYPDDLSPDGRFAVFMADGRDIVRGDHNRAFDVFRHDRKTDRTIRVSVTSDGEEGGEKKFSGSPAVSANGRYVAFESRASLDPAYPTDERAIYLHDVVAGTTKLVSRGSEGPGNGPSDEPRISDDGRYVAFVSIADNLVPDDTNANYYPRAFGIDGFVRDVVAGKTFLVTVGDAGQQADGDTNDFDLSPDGDYVCWSSDATNLTVDTNPDSDVFLRGPLNLDEEE